MTRIVQSSRPTQIYLLRHGETDWNVMGRAQGTSDIPMNATGLAQAASLAIALRDIEFHAAYTSPLARAWRTAEIVLEGRGLHAIVRDDLRELSYGDWQGLTPEQWPEGAARRWAADPWRMSFPNGESLALVQHRALAAITDIVSENEGRCVLVAAHGHVNRLLMLHASHASPATFWDIAQPNGSAYFVEYRINDSTLEAAAAFAPLAYP